MGIEPLGALEHSNTMVERRVWRIPTEQLVTFNEEADELQERLF